MLTLIAIGSVFAPTEASVTATVQVTIDVTLDAGSYSFGTIQKGTNNIPMSGNPHYVRINTNTTVAVNIKARIDNGTTGGLLNSAAPADKNRVIDNVGWWQTAVGSGDWVNLASTTDVPVPWMQNQGPPGATPIDLKWYGACSTDADQYGGAYGGTLHITATQA